VTRSAWPGNESYRNMIVTTWSDGERRLVIAVNYAPTDAQSYTAIDLPELTTQTVLLADLMSEARYERQRDALWREGLYLALPPWGYHVFETRAQPAP
jgi:hypothetical protein